MRGRKVRGQTSTASRTLSIWASASKHQRSPAQMRSVGAAPSCTNCKHRTTPASFFFSISCVCRSRWTSSSSSSSATLEISEPEIKPGAHVSLCLNGEASLVKNITHPLLVSSFVLTYNPSNHPFIHPLHFSVAFYEI